MALPCWNKQTCCWKWWNHLAIMIYHYVTASQYQVVASWMWPLHFACVWAVGGSQNHRREENMQSPDRKTPARWIQTQDLLCFEAVIPNTINIDSRYWIVSTAQLSVFSVVLPQDMKLWRFLLLFIYLSFFGIRLQRFFYSDSLNPLMILCATDKEWFAILHFYLIILQSHCCIVPYAEFTGWWSTPLPALLLKLFLHPAMFLINLVSCEIFHQMSDSL